MSTYFFGCCHDCKVYIEASNMDLEYAEKLTNEWAVNKGHANHNIETNSEYAEGLFEDFYIGQSLYRNVTDEIKENE